jgi:hypothetical protein
VPVKGKSPVSDATVPAVVKRMISGSRKPLSPDGCSFWLKWDGIRTAFHGFDPAKVASLQPADIAQIEADARVICNTAKIEATVQNAQELLAILDRYGGIRAYLASFPDARSAAGDLRRRFRFLGDTGVWRLLTSAARDLG